MSHVSGRAFIFWAVIGGVAIGACGSPSAPTAVPVKSSQSQDLGRSPALFSSALNASALSEGFTDVTLADAGWTCIQPGNGLTLCAPPGLGLPPIPPTGNGLPSYDAIAFTADHQLVHHVKLLRPDIYHGEPCLGGDPWSYLAIVQYYECLIPAQG